MSGRQPFKRIPSGARPAVVAAFSLGILIAAAALAGSVSAGASASVSPADAGSLPDGALTPDHAAAGAAGAAFRPSPRYGPPGDIAGIPTDAQLESSHAVIGQILIDNQNIFNLADPKENTGLFRLANRLHPRTRAGVIRSQLLFRTGERFSRERIAESERILRADGIFYDAWIRIVRYHDNQVDLEVTTRDVWTLNPGFNFGRSGGTNSTGVQLEEINLAGTGTTVKLAHSSNVDRSSNQIEFTATHAFESWLSYDLNYTSLSDGHLHEFTLQRPFYALDTRWAAGVYGIDDLQTDSLYDRGQVVDEFQDQHHAAQIYAGLSDGLSNGWVHRWSAGFTYDAHRFAPARTWTGTTVLPEDRRFEYPWLQFDLLENDYLKLYNHDQIARTEDFYLGTSASVRAGYAPTAFGSSRNALVFQSNASRGFKAGGSTLLLFTDFSGRVSAGRLENGVFDLSVRYYVEQSKNWLFFTTLSGTKGWRLDLDDQVLLGGDNGVRGYPLRYQGGTGRALVSVEQRYFTDWYPFRLFRVGGAVFIDAGRTWGTVPLAAPNLGVLTDAGFGLRVGNARSGLGNVVHIDLAFPFNGDRSIKRVQFLVQTERSF